MPFQPRNRLGILDERRIVGFGDEAPCLEHLGDQLKLLLLGVGYVAKHRVLGEGGGHEQLDLQEEERERKGLRCEEAGANSGAWD